MTKEIRRIEIIIEKSICIDLLVDKDVLEKTLLNDCEEHFECYSDDWDMFERISAYCTKKIPLREYLVNPKRDTDIYMHLPNKDAECLEHWDEMDEVELLEEEQVAEREARDNAAQMKLEV